MPNIRTRQFDPTLPRVGTGPGEGEIIGAAIQGFAQDVAQVGQDIDDFKTRRDKSRMNAEFAETKVGLKKAFDEQSLNAETDDAEFGQRFMDDFVTPALEGLEGGRTTRSKTHFEQEALGIKTGFQMATNEFQLGLNDQFEQDNATREDNALLNASADNPEDVALVIDEYFRQRDLDVETDLLKQPFADERKRLFAMKAFTQSAAEDAAFAPERFQARDAEHEFDEWVDPDKLRAFRAQATRNLKAAGKAQQFQLQAHLKDAEQRFKETGFGEENIGSVAEYGVAFAGPDTKGFQTAIRTRADVLAVGRIRQTQTNKPFAERVTNISQLRNAVMSPDFKGDFSALFAALELEENVYSQDRAFFDKDQATFLTTHNPGLLKSETKWITNPSPELFADFAVDMEVIGRHYDPNRPPSFLTKRVTEALKPMFDEKTIGRGDNLQAAMGAFNSLTGDLSARQRSLVNDDMRRKEVLTPQTSVAIAVALDGNLGIATEIARGAAFSKSEWKVHLSNAIVNNAEKQVNVKFAKFLDTVQAQNEIEQASELRASVLGAVLSNASITGADSKSDLAKDAERIIRRAWESSYTVYDSMRVPNEVGDTDAVRWATNRIRNSGGAGLDLYIPPSSTGLTLEERTSDMERFIKEKTFWIANEDETGARLVSRGLQPILENVSDKQIAINRSWEELRQMGVDLRETSKTTASEAAISGFQRGTL